MIQSHTNHDIYYHKGEFFETMLTGQTGDISELGEHEWYFWVIFRDTSVSFPISQWVLGRYYGTSGNVGPEMAAKLLKSHVQIVI